LEFRILYYTNFFNEQKKQYEVTLMAKGIISEDLHYEIYAQNWWKPCKFDQTSISLIPYRLFISVNCSITVLNDEQTQNPCFCCICDDY
jgi:hypothetical protein